MLRTISKSAFCFTFLMFYLFRLTSSLFIAKCASSVNELHYDSSIYIYSYHITIFLLPASFYNGTVKPFHVRHI